MRAKVDKDGYETAFHYGTNGQVEEICYADGRKVSLTYNAIRQLEEVKDWLGTTKSLWMRQDVLPLSQIHMENRGI